MKKLDVDNFQEMILSRRWLVLSLGGAAIILGGILLFYPGVTLVWLVRFLGVYWLVAGLLLLFLALTKRAGIAILFRGILGILIGLFVLGYPLFNIELSPSFLINLLALSGLILGGMTIVSAFLERPPGAGPEWSIVGEGVFTILISLVLVAAPLLTLRIVVPLVAISSIVTGIGLIVVAFEFGDTLEG